MMPKSEGFKNWVARTDEEDRDWKKFYTSNRGTLVHYGCLNPFSKEELWSEDEQQSRDELKGNRTSNRTGMTGGADVWADYKQDRDWCIDTWEFIRDIWGIYDENDPEDISVIDVEVFSANRDVGFAGQFDLLYHDREADETVLADLKTSKYIYEKHKLQLAAYAHAIPMVVDRAEVIRMNPEKADWSVSCSNDWDRSLDELYEEFTGYRDELSEEHEEEMLEAIEAQVASGAAVTES
ncbi:PD-(D/E)XK nuclease family protein [Halosegnis longus]|uniref:PD-(D/E)XK nuclease family protein n=1 Tax=Halosegnis longus TaxID=2216012 RepID=UPI00129DA295|nr:PD-(D/E)XK nuclease family protein [Halosegnis longus]